MLKIIIVSLFLLFNCAAGFAQGENENSSSPGAKASASSSNYSESVPYQPRELTDKQSKQKKEKQSEKKIKPNEKSPLADSDSSGNDAAETVNVAVSVYDRGGKGVGALKKSDFILFVDDKEQEISSFKTDDEPLNVFLVLDTSPSTAAQINDIQHFAAEFLESLDAQTNVQIIQFNEKPNVLTALTNDRQILKKAVGKLKDGEGTSLYEALRSILQKQVASVAGRKVILILTDGVDTTSRKAGYESSLIEAECGDAAIYPFYLDTYDANVKSMAKIPGSIFGSIIGPAPGRGFNPAIEKAEYELGKSYLNDLARLSGGRTFEVKKLSLISRSDFERIRELFKPQYYIGFNAAQPGEPGKRRQIKVRINRPNLIVRARGSYILKNKFDKDKND